MFDLSARYYDLIYGFKNYAREAEIIRSLMIRFAPNARTILDVACGTGEHDRFLKRDYLIDGVDLNTTLVEIARRKNPECSYVIGDMRSFDLGRTYDSITCLFSAIGSMNTTEDLESTLRSFRRHLLSGGLALVEPWLSPGQWNPGAIQLLSAKNDLYTVSRMAQGGWASSRVSTLNFHYLVGSEAGIEHFTETEELGLFTHDEMKQAFGAAGFEVKFDPEGLIGRGLYIARAA
ncbi:MAG TPA: class I SAM-dependent methyltransferase [Candidatus Binataceae bacterium]